MKSKLIEERIPCADTHELKVSKSQRDRNMEFQLRDYKVKPGQMNEWIDEWRAKIYPLRVKLGFRVVGAWTINQEDRFIWILSFEGPEGSFAQAEKAYFDSTERKSIKPDPVRHLASTSQAMIRGIL